MPDLTGPLATTMNRSVSPRNGSHHDGHVNEPAGLSGTLCEWYGVTSTVSGRGLETITHDHESDGRAARN